MKRSHTLLLLSLLVAAFLTPAFAEERVYPIRIEGKKERKQQRYESYAKKLKGDKARIFRQYGYTPHRLRVADSLEDVVETWTYPARGIEFTFDGNSELTDTRRVPVESRGVEYF